MVVGAPQVDYTVKAAFKFIAVVGNIGCKVGRHAVIADNHAVFIVAVLGSFQPQSAVFFIHITALGQQIAGFLNFVAVVQSLLAEPNVVSYVKRFQILFQRRQFFFQRNGAEFFNAFILIHVQEFIAVNAFNAFCRFNYIMSVVAVFRKFHIDAVSFKVTRVNGGGKVVNLVAGVIDVIFTGYIVACRFHKVSQRAANRCAASMPYMQRAGRVGAYIFQLDFFFGRCGQVAVISTGFDNVGKHIAQPVIF